MEARLTALENRLRQTERALVVERLARQTAEVAHKTVEARSAGVDTEEIGNSSELEKRSGRRRRKSQLLTKGRDLQK